MAGKVPVPETEFVGTLERIPRDGVTRWRNADGKRLYEWDSLHGHFEAYNKRGLHVGVVDGDGIGIGDAVPGRRIDV